MWHIKRFRYDSKELLIALQNGAEPFAATWDGHNDWVFVRQNTHNLSARNGETKMTGLNDQSAETQH